MKDLFIRYRFFLLLVVVNIFLLFLKPDLGTKSISITWSNLVGMLTILPPIFIFLGLLDVWVERETMIKIMGENSGILGVFIAYFLGSAAVGPLYAAFPVAGVLLKKGCKFSNVLIFMGAWSTTKIPLLLFEASSMGTDFMLLRFALNIPGIALIAYFTAKMLSPKERAVIYQNAEQNVS
ncbi:MAG: permease [Gracilibacter sp. BRH_c7a]|nr:MAG: permease [Gracilibacter sp. BRH_c7a]KUO65098.1 MAG: permease [Gracilibacter sp. BRH_c7a]